MSNLIYIGLGILLAILIARTAKSLVLELTFFTLVFGLLETWHWYGAFVGIGDAPVWLLATGVSMILCYSILRLDKIIGTMFGFPFGMVSGIVGVN